MCSCVFQFSHSFECSYICMFSFSCPSVCKPLSHAKSYIVLHDYNFPRFISLRFCRTGTQPVIVPHYIARKKSDLKNLL